MKACPDNTHQDFGSPAQECWFSRQMPLYEEGGKGALKSPAGEGGMSGTGGGGVRGRSAGTRALEVLFSEACGASGWCLEAFPLHDVLSEPCRVSAVGPAPAFSTECGRS